ncbi:MAG: putative nucleotide-diphospho-sugar transferase [Pseudomonadota bacterium]
MEHYIFVAPTRADCDALRDKRPGLACAYSKLITGATGPTASMAESATFTVWTTRKRLVGRWTELGLGVLQADLDVIFYDNPYPALKGVLRDVSLVHLQEGPCNEARANGGLLYAQHACSGSVAHWVLREVYERVHRNLEDPRTMNMYYPDLIGDETDLNSEAARRHVVVQSSDEQDTLRDCLLSAFTGKDLHLYGARATAWEKFGREHWLKRYRDEVGDYNCDAVELDSEALPGVCYIPSHEGVHPRALVHSLTAHRTARANTDAAEGDVLCGGGEADGLVDLVFCALPCAARRRAAPLRSAVTCQGRRAAPPLQVRQTHAARLARSRPTSCGVATRWARSPPLAQARRGTHGPVPGGCRAAPRRSRAPAPPLLDGDAGG